VELLALRSEGKSLDQIASLLGITKCMEEALLCRQTQKESARQEMRSTVGPTASGPAEINKADHHGDLCYYSTRYRERSMSLYHALLHVLQAVLVQLRGT